MRPTRFERATPAFGGLRKQRRIRFLVLRYLREERHQRVRQGQASIHAGLVLADGQHAETLVELPDLERSESPRPERELCEAGQEGSELLACMVHERLALATVEVQVATATGGGAACCLQRHTPGQVARDVSMIVRVVQRCAKCGHVAVQRRQGARARDSVLRVRVHDDRCRHDPLPPGLQRGPRELGQLDAGERVSVHPALEAGLHLVALLLALEASNVLDVVLARLLDVDDLRRATRPQVLEPSLGRLLRGTVPLGGHPLVEPAESRLVLLARLGVRVAGRPCSGAVDRGLAKAQKTAVHQLHVVRLDARLEAVARGDSGQINNVHVAIISKTLPPFIYEVLSKKSVKTGANGGENLRTEL